MRYKNAGGLITFFLSSREIQNYSDNGRLVLKNEGNIIEDGGIPFQPTNGIYSISINGYPIKLQFNFEKMDSYTVKVRANIYEFEHTRLEPINKYQIYRLVVKYLRFIITGETSRSDWHILDQSQSDEGFNITIAADDPATLDSSTTLEQIDHYAKEKGFTNRAMTGPILIFGQNELTRRELRYR